MRGDKGVDSAKKRASAHPALSPWNGAGGQGLGGQGWDCRCPEEHEARTKKAEEEHAEFPGQTPEGPERPPMEKGEEE